jgi:pyruvate,water dikinase
VTAPIDLSAAARAYNAINFPAPADGSWVTTNLAEALPGVATPMGWGIWAEASDRAARTPFHAMGALPKSGLAFPERSEDRVTNLFYGRIAIRVDYFCEMGDLVPGATGEAVARDAFGFVPPDYVSRTSRRRWPAFFGRMPVTFARTPAHVRRILGQARARYPVEVARAPTLGADAARAQYAAAAERFKQTMCVQATIIACVIQPVYSAVQGLAANAGVDAAPLMKGHGSHIETEMIQHLWKVSRGRMTLERFLALHGFYGPDVGEISNPSWREDPAPLRMIVEHYRSQPEEADPGRADAAAEAERRTAEAELLSALPRAKRGGARLALALGRRNIPLRSTGKVAYLHEMDIARAATRRIGALLAADGVLADAADAFHLTPAELLGEMPDDAVATVAERKAVRAEYEHCELRVHWTGAPTPIAVSSPAVGEGPVSGEGVSPGVVEGRARVVTDPSRTEMEPGEILIARTTDPSWASVMFLASALVVDIGGELSHAAVVARELGVPCVMGTGNGTRALRTGDICRVDGATGSVEVLEAVAREER